MDGYDGYVHSGMLKCADKIAKSFVKAAVIQALKKHPGFSLVLCGHSLGGGVASLLTLLWSREITLEGGKKVFVTNKEEGFPERPIRCFVYVSFTVFFIYSTVLRI
jgi:pimeloyl-ACP methyl ester carboxylesterase